MRSLGLPSKTSSCEVNALKIKNTVDHDVNPVLECFRKHSTNFFLSYLNDKSLKGFDKGMMTGMILIDLPKVLATIYHDVLLQKLYTIGFSKHTVNWVKS